MKASEEKGQFTWASRRKESGGDSRKDHLRRENKQKHRSSENVAIRNVW